MIYPFDEYARRPLPSRSTVARASLRVVIAAIRSQRVRGTAGADDLDERLDLGVEMAISMPRQRNDPGREQVGLQRQRHDLLVARLDGELWHERRAQSGGHQSMHGP